jgi:ATP-binding cassette subfamily C protein
MINTMSKPTLLTEAFRAIRPGFATAIFFSLFINLLAFVGPLYMLQIYDRVIGSRNVATLIAITIIAGFLLVVYALLEKIRSSILVRLGLLFSERAKAPLFDAVLRGTLIQPGSNHVQVLRDLDTIREFLTGAGLIAFCDTPWVPIFVAACFIMHPWFGYVATIGAIVIFTLAIANEFSTRNKLKDASLSSVIASSYAVATFRNADVLHAMGMLSGLRNRWLEKHNEGLQLQASASDRAGFLVAGSKFTRAFLQVSILGVGAYLAITQESTAGAMIAASIVMGRALAPVESAVAHWKMFLAARSAYDRIRGLLSIVPNEPNKISLPAPKGAISVEGIYAVPPGGKHPVLQELSFALKPGEILGLVGPSAAGKSSLARVLVGVWRVNVGRVRIDGAELSHWNQEQLGQFVGYLPQDVELFAGSIAENISRFGEQDEEKIFAAAQLAGVHDMIQALPGGYNTQVGEGAHALSGGQRQRIGLARALYGKPSLIVLDEPNASLDADGENALLSAIQQLKREHCTIVLITHKTNILAAVDKVAVMSAGRLQAFGSRDEVLSRLLPPRISAVAAAGPAVAATR